MMIIITCFFSIIDLIITGINFNQANVIRDYSFPWIAEGLKPILALGLFRAVRNYAKRFLFVIKASGIVIIFSVVYVAFFTWTG